MSILRVPHVDFPLAGGPIRERSEQIIELLGRGRQHFVLWVCQKKWWSTKPLSCGKKAQQNPEIQTPFVFLNRSAKPTIGPEEQALLNQLSAMEDLGKAAAEVLLAGRWETKLEEATAESLTRLNEAIGEQVITIPRLGAHGGLPEGSRNIVQQMQTSMSAHKLYHHNFGNVLDGRSLVICVALEALVKPQLQRRYH